MRELASDQLTLDSLWGRVGVADTVRVGEGVPRHRWKEGGAWHATPTSSPVAQLGSQWLTSPLE